MSSCSGAYFQYFHVEVFDTSRQGLPEETRASTLHSEPHDKFRACNYVCIMFGKFGFQ